MTETVWLAAEAEPVKISSVATSKAGIGAKKLYELSLKRHIKVIEETVPYGRFEDMYFKRHKICFNRET